MLRFDRENYLSLLVKSILSERLINSLREANVSLFSEFINIVSLYCWFALYKEYITWWILFSKFLYVLPARSIGNL